MSPIRRLIGYCIFILGLIAFGLGAILLMEGSGLIAILYIIVGIFTIVMTKEAWWV